MLPTPVGRKYSTGSSLLTLSPSITLTYSPFYIAFLAVDPSLTFPLLSPHSSCPVPGRCFRTWVLNTNQFFYLSISLSSLSPQRASPLPSIFRKLGKMTLPSTFTPTVFPQRNTRPFLFSLLLSLYFWN